MVRNLIDNAVRHANGHVLVTVRVSGDLVTLDVDDDGPGVPIEARSSIFDRFTRLDEARTRRDGGAGLGLAIVARIALVVGGEVDCLDAPGLGGARLQVRLPRSEHARAPAR